MDNFPFKANTFFAPKQLITDKTSA